jgi:putative ABC transport system substrate-binding protein
MPGFAEEKKIKIEVLQVTDIEPYQNSYRGFVKELERNGFVQGKNLSINRKIIAFDVEKGGLWKKIGVLMDIKSEASRIVSAKPDLVLTIGTPATKYAKDKIVSAGIPLVFTAVAVPTAAGCKSMTEAGPGFTGATLHMDMKGALQIVRLAFPKVKTIGMVNTDDENGIAHVQEAKKNGPAVGIAFLTKEISKNDKLTPSLTELQKQGAEAFAVPLDTYYGIRDYEATKELSKFSDSTKIPVISFALMKVPGAVLYVGSDFGTIGALSGQQAVKILKDGAKPGTLPILRQEDLKILVDTKELKALNYQLPMEILKIAKDVE